MFARIFYYTFPPPRQVRKNAGNKLTLGCKSLFPREVANDASRQTCYSPSDPLCKECEKSRAVRMDDPTLLFQLICQLKIISCI